MGQYNECGDNQCKQLRAKFTFPHDAPRLLRSAEERQKRKALLYDDHVAPLTEYVEELGKSGLGDVPDFDPWDGGTNAKILFLFEKPGPKADGSGFISRNNDDGTAEATFNFMREAGIPRHLTCIWNVIPGWDKKIKFNAAERKAGVAHLQDLLTRLPKIQTIALVGKTAQLAERHIKDLPIKYNIFHSAHPSPRVRGFFPDKWNNISNEWRKAKNTLMPQCACITDNNR